MDTNLGWSMVPCGGASLAQPDICGTTHPRLARLRLWSRDICRANARLSWLLPARPPAAASGDTTARPTLCVLARVDSADTSPDLWLTMRCSRLAVRAGGGRAPTPVGDAPSAGLSDVSFCGSSSSTGTKKPL